nr:39S ribosomal protein L2, mitochondrial [Leptinotarsa decemlineata]
MGTLVRIFNRLTLLDASATCSKALIPVRYKAKHVEKPEIGHGKSFRRIVHYPEEYTVKPLNVTNLGGRDPKTGRMVVKGIGGGIKHKYHWIDWKRVGPSEEGQVQIEKVIKIIKDGCRTANIALVANGDKLKYILATVNMKPGDLIKTSCHIPRIPVRANEGDAYPLGALPIGTQVHCVEKYPGLGGFLVHSAGTYATIVRKAPNDHVVIMMPSKKEFSLPAICMCTVGRLSNIEHGSTPIGSAQRNRELGNRPRSGLWQRKKGCHGRKIRRPPPVKTIVPLVQDDIDTIVFSCDRPFVKTPRNHFHY